MKRIVSIALSFLLIFTLLSTEMSTIVVYAAVGGVTGDCKWSIEGTTLVISGNGKMGDYNSDAYVASTAPWRSSNITQVIIQKGVTSIGDYAFDGCKKLTNITVPDSVNVIGLDAFRDCTALATITLPNSVTNIGQGAFSGCTNLSEITIPNGVKRINGNTFWGCTKLAYITIPDAVTSVGEGAFSDTLWLSNQPDGVVYAGKVSYTCKGTYPSVISLREGTTEITGRTFCGCTELERIILPDSVENIGYMAFSDCTGLASIAVSNDNPVYYAENNCLIEKATNKLVFGCKNSVIPDEVTGIGDCAFDGCTGLETITIPEGVTSIGDSAFFGCTGLKTVNFNAINCITMGKVYVGIGIIDLVSFGDCTNLQTVNFGKAVTNIPAYAFCECTGLTDVIISENVKNIGDFSFCGCTGLTNIIIPENVKDIGRGAFRGCTGLHSVSIPGARVDGTSISNSAFSECRGLEEVTIGENVTSIGDNAFEDCTGLKTIHFNALNCSTMGMSVSDYSNLAVFKNCTSVRTLIIGEGVTTISPYAFYGCRSLTTIIIPESLKTIGDRALYTPNNIQDVWYAGSENDRENIDMGTSAYFLTMAKWHYNTCKAEHTYSGVCDTTCNACDWTRNAVPHTYDNACDEICNVCGEKRTVPGHNYTLNGGYTCDICKRSKTPEIPTVESKTADGFTLVATEGFEYSLDGVVWQKSNVFSNLTPGKTYTVYQRVAEFETGYASEASEGTVVRLCTLGDLDGDEEISDWDGVLLARYLAGWDVDISNADALDIDGDGEITDWDGVLLDRYLAGWDIKIG